MSSLSEDNASVFMCLFYEKLRLNVKQTLG